MGAGIVWAPVAAYFLLTGAIWQGVVLGLFGVFVIGLVDNVLRPILVGKDTQMPDYMILVSTLGGLAVFGLNGFVIGPLIAALFMSSWDAVPRNQTAGAAALGAEPAGLAVTDALRQLPGGGQRSERAADRHAVSAPDTSRRAYPSSLSWGGDGATDNGHDLNLGHEKDLHQSMELL